MNFRPTNIEKGEGGKFSLFKLIGPIIMSLIVAKKIPGNDNITYESYLNGNYVESMFIEPVTEYELQIEINNLNENKSAGHNEVSAKMVKTISENIIKPLTYIYRFKLEKYQTF